ncbi:MAG: hypothetical protein E7161_01645 [Firmicutes bacterium]|nr:hypothetical protein [Bacillota bacterium]
MKEYVEQIYNEGLGLTIYKPIEHKIEKIKNSGIKKVLICLCKIFYLIFAIAISIILFLATYPL